VPQSFSAFENVNWMRVSVLNPVCDVKLIPIEPLMLTPAANVSAELLVLVNVDPADCETQYVADGVALVT
jgi:hypothetical protein